MKSAIFIQEGSTQVVLTPENDWERAALRMVRDALADGKASVFEGSFYECRGGYWRHDQNARDDRSLMIRMDAQPVVRVRADGDFSA